MKRNKTIALEGRERASATVRPPGTPPAFHVMTKPRGAICNLDCHYCFYLAKEHLFPDATFRMSDELLEMYTRQYIEAQQVPEVTFTWQGGEPTLMGIDFYRKAIAFQHRYRKPGMTIHNTLQTNGVNLDDYWAQFFKENNFLIGVSLDGPQELHDIYRVDKGGNPTFKRVMTGIEVLKKHQVDFNILACVNSANAGKPLEIYRFFRDEVKAHFIQFIPIVEREHHPHNSKSTRVSSRTVTSRQYGEFLIAIFDEWIRRDVGRIYVQIFDVSLGVWYGLPADLCIFSEACGTALALEHTGDLYACDHFVEPTYHLGNIQHNPMIELVSSKQQRRFGQAKRTTLPAYCRKCDVRFICNGGCPKERFLRTPEGEPGLNYLCEGYKAFFRHIDQPMKLMSALLQQGRAPAEIMNLQ